MTCERYAALLATAALTAAASGQDAADSPPPEKPNAAERIEAALDKKVHVEFVQTSLQDAADYWADLYEIPIRVRTRKLEEDGIGNEEEFSLILADVRMGDALDIILGDDIGDLTYVVENDVLWITTLRDARESLETRVYAVPEGLAAADVAAMLVEHRLCPAVRDHTVAEDGRVTAVGQSLVVTQSQPGHRNVAEFMDLLEGLDGPIQSVPVPPTPAKPPHVENSSSGLF